MAAEYWTDLSFSIKFGTMFLLVISHVLDGIFIGRYLEKHLSNPMPFLVLEIAA